MVLREAIQSVVRVELPQNAYDVAIAPGSLDQLGSWIQRRAALSEGTKILLVSNPTVFDLYGNRAIAALEQAGYPVCTCILPDGEPYKTLDSIQQIYTVAQENYLERASAIVALGGGVIGDMAGFAAATWLRGIRFIQVPTTLLAMVDASVGGKTGVNHPKGKNLIGAFYQPRLVLIDPQVLQTLPEREFRAGMAEVIKYGVIRDAELFAQLEASPQLAQQSQVSEALMQTILTRSCQAKAAVVTEDEKEQKDVRATLNYGHTVGHTLESLTGYQQINHGEAVAIGMIVVGQIALDLKLWDARSCDRQTALIQKAGLPTHIPSGVAVEDILTTLQSDKKVRDGRVRFIIPTQIGHVIVTDTIPPGTLRQVLQRMIAP